MWLVLLEALLALFLLLFIVWWTMFSGKKPDRSKRASSQKTDKSDGH